MYQDKTSIRKTRAAVIGVAILLALLFCAFAIIVYFSGKKELSRSDIQANIESCTVDEGYDYACSYITKKIGIKNFDQAKFKRIESFYKQLYVGELPSSLELAKSTASLYLEYFYDTVQGANDKAQLTDALITCYVASTGDRYGYYRTEKESEEYSDSTSGTYVGIGVTVLGELDENGNIVILSVGDTSPAKEAGILAGDIITSVGGEPVKTLGMDGATAKIKGPEGSTVLVGVKRGELELEFTVTRRLVIEKSVNYKVIRDNVGYIEITGFKGNTVEQFKEALDALEALGVKAVVFDMRNNPGGLLTAITDVLSYLVPTGTKVVSYVTADGREQVKYAENDAGGTDHVLKVPAAVLCNKYTASAAELFTAALRDYNDMGILDAITVGETTFAKGIMQSTYTLSDKTSLTLTIAFYNPPSGVNYDKVGVAPDYPAPKEVAEEKLPEYAADLIALHLLKSVA